MGKTTILEAIRFVKAMTAARTQNETTQVMNSLGISSPGIPNRVFADAITGNPNVPVHVRCVYQLSKHEMETLKTPAAVAEIAVQIMLSNIGRQFANPAELIGLLSTPQAQQNQNNFSGMIRATIADLESGKKECVLDVTVDPLTGQIRSGDPLSGTLIAYLDKRLPPYKALFSYFPADRAIPAQDPQVQIGINDASIQLESYNSQPQQKFSRLKNTIFSSVIAGRASEQAVQFEAIFSRILRGKTLKGVGINAHGALKISIEDIETKKEFSIDAMSSGEKGLILTFLLIAQSLETGGIVLLDEPELHLNPAVCRDVLTFLVEEYAIPNDLQLIICSHSPEILSVAFERDDCSLFHLISGDLLTPVRRQDFEEVEGALRRLGAPASESLLYKGTVFVEGDHDSDVLEEGFRELFQRYKLRDLGGRTNVEKEIEHLQDKERSVDVMSKTFFILDYDDKATHLKSTKSVKVLQWKRRCLENYLIDINSLTDLVKNDQYASDPITNVAAVQQALKRLAFEQIPEMAARQIYAESNFTNTSLTNREMMGKNFSEFADLIYGKIERVREQFGLFEEAAWKSKFIKACEEREAELRERWEASWETECDGKKLVRDFHSLVKIRESMVKFKIRVINTMATNSSENWLAMKSLLADLMLGGA
jgi:hypothetical protein